MADHQTGGDFTGLVKLGAEKAAAFFSPEKAKALAERTAKMQEVVDLEVKRIEDGVPTSARVWIGDADNGRMQKVHNLAERALVNDLINGHAWGDTRAKRYAMTLLYPEMDSNESRHRYDNNGPVGGYINSPPPTDTTSNNATPAPWDADGLDEATAKQVLEAEIETLRVACEDANPDVAFKNCQAFHDGVLKLTQSTQTAWALEALEASLASKREVNQETWFTEHVSEEDRRRIKRDIALIGRGGDPIKFHWKREIQIRTEMTQVLTDAKKTIVSKDLDAVKEVAKKLIAYASTLTLPEEKAFVYSNDWVIKFGENKGDLGKKREVPAIERDAKIVDYVNTVLALPPKDDATNAAMENASDIQATSSDLSGAEAGAEAEAEGGVAGGGVAEEKAEADSSAKVDGEAAGPEPKDVPTMDTVPNNAVQDKKKVGEVDDAQFEKSDKDPDNRFKRRYALSFVTTDENIKAVSEADHSHSHKNKNKNENKNAASDDKAQAENEGRDRKGSFFDGMNLGGNVLVSGFKEFVAAEVTPPQLGLGVLLLACVYMHGWSSGRDQASDLCAQGPESCGAVTIVWTMLVATAKTWIMLVLLMMVLITIEIVVVGVLKRPLDETAVDILVDVGAAALDGLTGKKLKVSNRMLTLRIMFSWLLDPRMLAAIGASFAAAAAFASVYSTWIDLKDDRTPDDYRMCAQNAYAFQLVALIVFVVAQFWLKAWW